MLLKVAHISRPSVETERRGAPRRVISLGFDTADQAGNSRIVILNLSRAGLLFQTSAPLVVGESIQIAIPEAGLVEARIVRRTDDQQFGAEFDTPISQAAVSAVLLAAPARPIPQAGEQPASRDDRPSAPINLVPEWLLWPTAAVTTLVAGSFVYALAALPISG